MKNFDAVVIGAGQAGPSLAAKLAASGLKTAIVEKDTLGGTCVNTGCTPTKTMVASAKTAFIAQRAFDFGIKITGDIKVDMKEVKARKDRIVSNSVEGLEKWLNGTDNLSIFRQQARFVHPYRLNIGDETLEAEKIFLNVGGRPFIPNGFNDVEYLTNRSIMDLDYAPEHLIVVGGSYIGLEFGQMFRRFGSMVTIVEQGDRLVQREDPDVSEAILEILQDEGIEVRFNATCIGGIGKTGDLKVNLDCEEGPPELAGSHLLLATGRSPNTTELGLENTHINTDDKGFIKVNDRLETSQGNVWALGDCNGSGAFTHTAYNDFEIVAANLLEDGNRSLRDRILCYGLFTDPPLARVGMTETQIKEAGIKALVASRPMKRVARAKEKGETQGFMKFLVHAETQKFLGASILGVDGDETIHSIIDIMYADAPYTVIRNAVHIHPTVAELIPTTLGDLEPL